MNIKLCSKTLTTLKLQESPQSTPSSQTLVTNTSKHHLQMLPATHALLQLWTYILLFHTDTPNWWFPGYKHYQGKDEWCISAVWQRTFSYQCLCSDMTHWFDRTSKTCYFLNQRHLWRARLVKQVRVIRSIIFPQVMPLITLIYVSHFPWGKRSWCEFEDYENGVRRWPLFEEKKKGGGGEADLTPTNDAFTLCEVPVYDSGLFSNMQIRFCIYHRHSLRRTVSAHVTLELLKGQSQQK